MNMQSSGSVTHWLEELRAGESVAAQELWNRYFTSLTILAQSRLRSLDRVASGEDVALSALKSVMLGIQANRFPDLTDRTSLWPLLVTITARKSIDEMRRQLAGKRSASATIQLEDLQAIVGQEPSPEFAAAVADELERLVLAYDDTTLRSIAQRKLEGYTNQEIASELSLSVRTVIRKLNRIRQEWEEEASLDRKSS
jgi:DNA-directed RNA polymerase specialized sigma24 family protein